MIQRKLKEINGGNGPVICPEGFCRLSGSEEIVIGTVGRDGYCC